LQPASLRPFVRARNPLPRCPLSLVRAPTSWASVCSSLARHEQPPSKVCAVCVSSPAGRREPAGALTLTRAVSWADADGCARPAVARRVQRALSQSPLAPPRKQHAWRTYTSSQRAHTEHSCLRSRENVCRARPPMCSPVDNHPDVREMRILADPQRRGMLSPTRLLNALDLLAGRRLRL
jgi:hypothetical protein